MEKLFDLEYINDKVKSLIATDEVGRGCVAGPVTVASVFIEDANFENLEKLKALGLVDSKKLKFKKREKIFENLNIDISILKTGGNLSIFDGMLKINIIHIDPKIIDEVNILQATFQGMNHTAKEFLTKQNTHWLIDGNQSPNKAVTNQSLIIKGDSKSILIGIASNFAKQARDLLMKDLSAQLPHYGWESNAGYGTQQHQDAIKLHGRSVHHRKTFTFEWENA